MGGAFQTWTALIVSEISPIGNFGIRVLKLGESLIEFDDDADEFVNVCAFSLVSNDPDSFAPWLVSFNVLSGEIEEPSSSIASRSRMQVIGKVGLNLGELTTEMEAQIERKIPIALQMDGVSTEASLRLIVNFIEIKNSFHFRTASDDSLGTNLGDSTMFHRRTKSQDLSLGRSQEEKPKKSKLRLFGIRSSCMNSDESAASTSNSDAELGTLSSFESQLDLVNKNVFWKWRRRRRSSKHEAESPESGLGSWETKEIASRDGKTRLKANVFFASYDQRGEKAAGANACAAIVAVIAHWLQTNPDAMPTGPELDRLITDGSSEWRKLCEDELHKACFPDQHFDLETILRAGLRPLAVHPSNSRFGFFHPEEFEHLKDAVSFDDIWKELNENVYQDEPRVYIVRWNDHFFVLKVSSDANYIVDSLGERLHEGCTRAYILKFDDSSVMYATPEEGGGGEEKVIICRGKECCKEYMKKFLAAIQLRELKEEEEKGRKVDVFALYQKLQIDFHLSSSNSSAVSTANTSVSNSPNTSPGFLGDEQCM
ncbi:hypothetical protein Cgig2_008336 [Carnegiea gigantea]|uniref:C2 NT-type domain-containing protein n=1 Tax=Carnegiea gigantea TaxID=171969 RepID=A0A9Q1K7B5_9CARY|nr:hypothetical protein Cgig2_008336 [Carnegiea gigantea]